MKYQRHLHPRYVTAATYAAAAKVSTDTVRRRLRRGEIPGSRRHNGTGQWRIPWWAYEKVEEGGS